ncbi:MAG: hypothetical protein CMP20_04495 [Rickettsiales bacterium]|nr:hypothetical protein [Rickettsiales bacterium]
MWRNAYARLQKSLLEYPERFLAVGLLILVLHIGYSFAILGFEDFLNRFLFLSLSFTLGTGVEFIYQNRALKTR